MNECLQFNKAIDGEKAWKPPAASQLPQRARVPGKSTPLALVPKSLSSQQSVSHDATREKANRIVPQVLSHPGFLTGMAAGRLPGPSPACCQNERGRDPSRPSPPGARAPSANPRNGTPLACLQSSHPSSLGSFLSTHHVPGAAVQRAGHPTGTRLTSLCPQGTHMLVGKTASKEGKNQTHQEKNSTVKDNDKF